MDNKKNTKNIILGIGICIAVILIIVTLFSMQPKYSYKYSDIVGLFAENKVEEFTLDLGSGQMEITLRPGETLEPADPDTAPKVPTSNSDDKGIVIEYKIGRAHV